MRYPKFVDILPEFVPSFPMQANKVNKRLRFLIDKWYSYNHSKLAKPEPELSNDRIGWNWSETGILVRSYSRLGNLGNLHYMETQGKSAVDKLAYYIIILQALRPLRFFGNRLYWTGALLSTWTVILSGSLIYIIYY